MLTSAYATSAATALRHWVVQRKFAVCLMTTTTTTMTVRAVQLVGAFIRPHQFQRTLLRLSPLDPFQAIPKGNVVVNSTGSNAFIKVHRLPRWIQHVCRRSFITTVMSVPNAQFASGAGGGSQQKSHFSTPTTSTTSQREARIISLSAVDDDANQILHQAFKNNNNNSINGLPLGASLLGVGTTLEDFDHLRRKLMDDNDNNNNNNNDDAVASTKTATTLLPNVLFVSPSCPRASTVVPIILAAFPTIEWIHIRSAGIDFIVSEEFTSLTTASAYSNNNNINSKTIRVTNAKGQFSSTLAEYALMACAYFAKDLPRLMRQQQARKWDKYNVEELRGKTMGIVGYGDIGRACAKLAAVYGMRIIALRRRPGLSSNDPYCNAVYGRDKDSLHRLMSESDYIVCSAPSTMETRGMIDADAFDAVKSNAVFINLGRGRVIDEGALVRALQSGQLKGAALDVFIEEPIPVQSPLWDAPNILISPHNMDQTATFMHEATEFFLNENLPRFLRGDELLNLVDPSLGY